MHGEENPFPVIIYSHLKSEFRLILLKSINIVNDQDGKSSRPQLKEITAMLTNNNHSGLKATKEKSTQIHNEALFVKNPNWSLTGNQKAENKHLTLLPFTY